MFEYFERKKNNCNCAICDNRHFVLVPSNRLNSTSSTVICSAVWINVLARNSPCAPTSVQMNRQQLFNQYLFFAALCLSRRSLVCTARCRPHPSNGIPFRVCIFVIFFLFYLHGKSQFASNCERPGDLVLLYFLWQHRDTELYKYIYIFFGHLFFCSCCGRRCFIWIIFAKCFYS